MKMVGEVLIISIKETCYEVAAVEYAVALPYEKLNKMPNYDTELALDDVREYY